MNDIITQIRAQMKKKARITNCISLIMVTSGSAGLIMSCINAKWLFAILSLIVVAFGGADLLMTRQSINQTIGRLYKYPPRMRRGVLVDITAFTATVRPTDVTNEAEVEDIVIKLNKPCNLEVNTNICYINYSVYMGVKVETTHALIHSGKVY